MKRNDSKLTLKSYDDIFKTDEQRAEDAKEKVTELPLEELFPFPEHPFRVLDDDAMRDTAESVKQYGVLVPGVVHGETVWGTQFHPEKSGRVGLSILKAFCEDCI